MVRGTRLEGDLHPASAVLSSLRHMCLLTRSILALPSAQQESRVTQDHRVSLAHISISSALPTLALHCPIELRAHLISQKNHVLAMDTSDSSGSLPAAQTPSAFSTVSRDPSLLGACFGGDCCLPFCCLLQQQNRANTGAAAEVCPPRGACNLRGSCCFPFPIFYM